MSGKKYVPEDVYLVCDKGVKPSQLKTLSYTETWLYGEKMTTKADKMLIVNFAPFGACSCVNGAPCTAPVTDWTNVTDKITVGGNELLLENSELPCTLGGNIKIFYSLADAMAALPVPEKSFWDKLVDVGKGYMDFQKGLAKGLWKGLKGTVTGVVDLVVWAGKHHPIYQMVNPQGYAEQIQKDKETFKALGNLAKKGGTWVYRNSVVNQLTNPEDYMAAQAENAVMFDKMMDKAANMSAEDWGELTGQIAFEVVLEVATAGGAAALTAVKVADKTVDVARAVDKLDDLSDAAKAADKISDGSKLPPVPEELGDVVHKIDDVPAKKLDDVPPLKGKRPKKPEYPVTDKDGGLTDYGKWYYERPGWKKKTIDDVWQNAKDKGDGKVIDRLTQKEIVWDESLPRGDQWHMGHKENFEFRKHQKSAAEREIGVEQFRDEYNHADHIEPELPSSNLSHKGEAPDDVYDGF